MWTWLLRLLHARPRERSAESAPEELGALFTRPATWEDVITTARLLNRLRKNPQTRADIDRDIAYEHVSWD